MQFITNEKRIIGLFYEETENFGIFIMNNLDISNLEKIWNVPI